MKNRPLPVVIVAVALIVVGLAGFFSHVKDFFLTGENLVQVILVQLLRILAIVSGILLFRASNAGRWLAIGWVLSHIVISALNSTRELVAHIIIFVMIAILLFLPVSSAYFRRKKAGGIQ